MDLNDTQLEALRSLSYRVDTVNDLETRGAIDAAQADRWEADYLAEAAQIAGEPVELEQLLQARTVLEQGWFAGYFDFVHILWVVVGALVLVGGLGLVAYYVVPFIKDLPRVVHEVLAWAGCLALVILPWHLLGGGGAVALAAVGCLCMPLALLLSLDIHIRTKSSEHLLRVMSGFLLLPWTAVALAYASPALAALPVLAFLVFTGDSLLPALEVTPFGGHGDVVPTAMLSAAGLLAVFAGVSLFASTGDWGGTLALFRPAATWLGGLTWFGGCLGLASRHYRQSKARFWGAQVLAVGTVTAALFVGSVYGLGGLQEVGGTFLAAYLLEKFFEIPWRREGYVWMCLSLAGILYVGASFAENHPQYFLGL